MNDATDGVNKPVFDVERPLYARKRRNLYSGTIFINKYVYVLLMIQYQNVFVLISKGVIFFLEKKLILLKLYFLPIPSELDASIN